jgi:hypothetical protein
MYRPIKPVKWSKLRTTVEKSNKMREIIATSIASSELALIISGEIGFSVVSNSYCFYKNVTP